MPDNNLQNDNEIRPAMSFLGLNTDSTNGQIKDGQLTYALNAIISSFDGNSITYQNEESNKFCSNPATKVVGFVVLRELNRTVYFLANSDTGESEIGYIENCKYIKLFNAECLNFDIKHPVKAVYRMTDCGIEIFFTDGFNPRRYIDLNKLPFKEITDPESCFTTRDPEIIDCNLMSVQRRFKIPEITPVDVVSGGDLTEGTYQFGVQYSDANGDAFTDYYNITNPVSIHGDLISADFNNQTDKSIVLDINNLDTDFEYYNLVVVKTINNIPSVELVGTFSITRPNTVYTYTGVNKQQIKLDIADVLLKRPVYEIAQDIATVDNTLLWANLKSDEQINYQRIASKIDINWITYRFRADAYKRGENTARYKGYMRDEVYAFEVVFLLKNGKQTDGFHIPGRIAEDLDLSNVSNDDVIDEEGTLCQPGEKILPRWKVYNTGTVTDLEFSGDMDACYEGPYQYGKMAYWESSDKYPCNTDVWGDLSDQPIRHHKFPDCLVSHIHDDNGYIYPIGVKINAQKIKDLIEGSDLSDEQKDNIAGFKIVRANRATNKSIVAKGLISNVGIASKDNTNYFYGNYPFNDIRRDPYILTRQSFVDSGSNSSRWLNGFATDDSRLRYCFHSPDTSFYQPFLGSILKLESAEYGKAHGHFAQVRNHSKYKLMSLGSYLISLGVATVVGFLSITVGMSTQVFDGVAALSTFEALVSVISVAIPKLNYFWQFNSVGYYDKFKSVTNNGKKQRRINLSTYATPGLLSVGDTYPINNYQRETSVYLRLGKTTSLLPYPHEISGVPQDTSRYTLSQIGNCNRFQNVVQANTSMFYASIKKPIMNQYGQIYSYETIDTGAYVNLLTTQLTEEHVFGGDIYINKFAYKSKIPFFTSNAVGHVDESDIDYTNLNNLGYPTYWFSSDSVFGGGGGGILAPLAQLFGVKANNLDCDANTTFYQKGKVYLFAYGIPYFFTESEVNVDMRQAGDALAKNYFPKVGTSIPDEWLQEDTVPIIHDNHYIYNKTFSKQNKENFFTHLRDDFDSTKDCYTYFPTRVLYSERQTNLKQSNWLFYKPANTYDLPNVHGKLTSIDGIENNQLLVRFENKSQVYNAMMSLEVSGKTAYVGGAKLFSEAPPLEFFESDAGYSGSQHRMLIKSEAGHMFIDAKRGTVFTTGLNRSITLKPADQGMSKWLGENLPFKILETFPDYPVDNAYNGVGITGVWDSTYSRYIVSKLDYEVTRPLNWDGEDFYTDIEIISDTECCPTGFTEVNGQCVKETRVPAVKIADTTFIGTAKADMVYSQFGSCIYNTGYAGNGTGTFTVIPTTNQLWNNNPSNAIRGPLNRCGIWNSVSDGPLNVWVGASTRVDIPTSKTYYVGIAGDNRARIKLDCSVLMEFDPQAMRINHNSSSSGDITFKRWHIYPVVIPAGIHYLTVEGLNEGSIAVFGCEIYDNTEQELVNATTLTDLRIIFSTASLRNRTIRTQNYECKDCGTVVEEADGFWCISTETTRKDCEDQVIKTIIKLGDPDYFCNKSWTLSYSPETQSWISFHSYIPNFYVPQLGYFQTGLNHLDDDTKPASIWNHNQSPTSYQRFYNILEPYVLEYPIKYELQDEVLTNVKDYTTVLRYENTQDFYEMNTGVYFNKAILYNNQQCSGLLNLVFKPLNNLKNYMTFPKFNVDSKDILVSKSDNFFNYNTFWDIVKYNDVTRTPFFKRTCEPSLDKELNNTVLDYTTRSHKKPALRAKNLKIRHIQDLTDEYKFLSRFITVNTVKSFK